MIMNIKAKEFLSIVKNFFKNRWIDVKSIFKLPDSKKYFAASFIMIIIFVIFTFPYEELVRNKLNEGAGKDYTSARISGFKAGIIGKTGIDTLEVFFKDYSEFSLRGAKFGLSLNPYRLLVSRRIKSNVDIQTLKYSGKANEFQGRVTGDVDITLHSKAVIPENGTVSLNITQGILQIETIKIPTSMGDISLKTEPVYIKLLTFDVEIINRVVKIRKLSIDSDQIKCSFTGNLTLEPFIKNSKFEIQMILNPESKILDQQRDIVSAFTKGGPIIINIGGTAGRPEFKLQTATAE